MVKYYLRYDDLQSQAAPFHNIGKTLVELESRLNSIANSMDGRNSSMALLKIQIQGCRKDISAIAGRVTSMGTAVLEINNMYLKAEKDCYNSFETSQRLIMWNAVLSGLGNLGQIGGAVKFAFQPFANWADHGVFDYSTNTGARRVVDIFKSTNIVLNHFWEWGKSNAQLNKLSRMLPEQAKKTARARWIGTNDIMKGSASKAGKWGTRFYNNFHKLDNPITRFKSSGVKGVFANYTAGGAKAAFAWRVTILVGILNAYDNKQEFKSGKISARRAVAETITETAIDIGKTVLVGVAVTAGLAATIKCAPVILVVAGTGIACGLIDGGTKYTTNRFAGEEKRFTEFASDLILDGGEWAIDRVNSAAEAYDDMFKEAFNNATNCINNPQRPTIGKWKAELGY